jgi:hypothetical protein
MRRSRVALFSAGVLAAGALAVPQAPSGHADVIDLVKIRGLRAPASVVRDDDGIAHIKAQNAHDLFFLQGCVHADDRSTSWMMPRWLVGLFAVGCGLAVANIYYAYPLLANIADTFHISYGTVGVVQLEDQAVPLRLRRCVPSTTNQSPAFACMMATSIPACVTTFGEPPRDRHRQGTSPRELGP